MKDLQKAREVAGGILVLALSMLAVAGCETTAGVAGSMSIKDLDDKLVALYQEKLAATGDAQLETNKKLGDVATVAARQGDAATASAASAVSFYRIAATAAWVAGPPHNTNVPDLSEKGAGACARLPGVDASQPRDCLVLKMTPNFALLDVKAEALRKLSGTAPTIASDSIDEVAALSEDVSVQIRKVVEARTAAGQQAESFDQYLHTNLNGQLCMLQGLLGRVDASSPPEPLLARVRTALRDARATLTTASMPTTCN